MIVSDTILVYKDRIVRTADTIKQLKIERQIGDTIYIIERFFEKQIDNHYQSDTIVEKQRNDVEKQNPKPKEIPLFVNIILFIIALLLGFFISLKISELRK